MDPLSAAASVIAVVQIADRIVALCKAYITGVSDAPTELRAILIEVGSVKCVLEVLELLDPSQKRGESVELLEKLHMPLEGCRQALKSLEDLFPPQSTSPVKGKRQRITLSLVTLAWPFKRDKALRLLEEIGRHKSTLSLGLTTEAAQDLKHIRKDVARVRDFTHESKKNQIFSWLVTTDPSPIHNATCELHEKHTGQWLTNSPEYSHWKAGELRFLWLHGIPGAGKTVLLSFITQNLQALRNDHKDVGSVYYYCYFARGQDETTHFLRWTISQLCRQMDDIPSEVEEIFKKGQQPSTNELLTMLAVAIRPFSRVYITIDALDESTNRETILAILRVIVAKVEFTRIQLLATSRRELDIERELLPICRDLSLSNAYVENDIQTYVHSRIREEHKFRRWPEELRAEIESKLVKGAEGMFRWAFCQLDILKRLNSATEVRVALKHLPKTLDETYERVLCNIAPEQRDMAHTTLHLVALGASITLPQLAELLAVDIENTSFDYHNRPLDPYAPLEACTCLLTHSADTGVLTFAHYTVKEYLVSSRISEGPAKAFKLWNDTMYFVAAVCFMVYMLNAPCETDEEVVMPLAINYWVYCVNRIQSGPVKDSLSTLVLDLLDPLRPHYLKWQSWQQNIRSRFPHWIPRWSAKPGEESCITLAYLCWWGLIEAARKFLERKIGGFSYERLLLWKEEGEQPCLEMLLSDALEAHQERAREKKVLQYLQCSCHFGTGHEKLTVLHLAAGIHATAFVELMISTGANVNTCLPTGLTVLMAAVSYQCTWPNMLEYDLGKKVKTIELLLSKGVELNPDLCSITPLQAALGNIAGIQVYTEPNFDSLFRIVQLLLHHGAEVNGVADDYANSERIRLTLTYILDKSPSWTEKSVDRYVEEITAQRGESAFYDTPLRILENELRELASYGQDHIDKILKLGKLKALLEHYGAKSFHLFPVKGLLGYSEEDMKGWAKIERLTTQSHATEKCPIVDLQVEGGL